MNSHLDPNLDSYLDLYLDHYLDHYLDYYLNSYLYPINDKTYNGLSARAELVPDDQIPILLCHPNC